MNGLYPLIFTDNVPANTSVYEVEYAINSSQPTVITRVSVFFRVASTGTNGSIEIHTLANRGGSAITVQLNSDNKTGVSTGSITIPAGGSIFVDFIDCVDSTGFPGLGDGAINLEIGQIFVPTAGVSPDEILSSVQSAIGRTIPRTMINWAVRDARIWIQEKRDVLGCHYKVSLNLVANQEEYALATYLPNFKRPIALYYADTSTTPNGTFILEQVKDRAEWLGITLASVYGNIQYSSPNAIVPSIQTPMGYNIDHQSLWIKFVTVSQTITVEYVGYLPTISGGQTDYVTTYYADAFLHRVYFNIFARLAKKDLAEYYKRLSLESLKESGQSDTNKVYAGGGIDLEG